MSLGSSDIGHLSISLPEKFCSGHPEIPRASCSWPVCHSIFWSPALCIRQFYACLCIATCWCPSLQASEDVDFKVPVEVVTAVFAPERSLKKTSLGLCVAPHTTAKPDRTSLAEKGGGGGGGGGAEATRPHGPQHCTARSTMVCRSSLGFLKSAFASCSPPSKIRVPNKRSRRLWTQARAISFCN